jgi:sarcosine oxidase subunit alpha
MAHRLAPLIRPVEFEFDGETIAAEHGEPLAFALIAADKLALSRSPKLHRPHGPYCLRGGCDGCVARVNGEPNVMTCMMACQGGERVETQNVLGSRKVDLMQVTDWFFPRGIDHHHFLAGVPAASFVVQKIARHVAGLGRLPDEPRPTGSARRETMDVLVIGGGAAGLTVALALASIRPTGLDIVVVDDGVSPGGSLSARGVPLPDLSGLHLYSRMTAAGIYDQEVLLVSYDEAIVARPRALVLATGAHDGTLPFPGNDLPGVMSARAGARLAHHGIAVGRRVALLGAGPYAEAFLEKMGDAVESIAVPAKATLAAEGGGRLSSVTWTDRSSRAPNRQPKRTPRRHEVDAMLVEALPAPSFELAEQAGASVTFDPARGGYVPSTDTKGRALPWVWCAGEVAGTGPSLEAIREQARAVASDVIAALSPR